MVNDHLSDFVTRIRNGYQAGLDKIEVPMIKTVAETARVIAAEGYTGTVEKKEKTLVIHLKYSGKKPAIMGIKRVSKPGARRYSGIKKLPRVWGGLGINILSTPKGIISEKQAKKLKTGGEIIAQVW
ncbi:MAG: SSU ribosomal protein S8P [Candidatus Amesbacteria bacterium GW2011_GWB1_47_19]|nr:MAG: SSU ribosomal protein S8P [Candidatus Amesbacteria bacterium GW2011_GWA1_44_24]KKU32039.1 MAG: SSU ribosomal protein S8P [Candidatus Amesbacteria bacterium GW2011_GWC1_46_24]KKU67723.1 MAG: SSU ribosomal protein S8P [Candidatus Amesbacteria bacterium GW2011_GWB1_47_19]